MPSKISATTLRRLAAAARAATAAAYAPYSRFPVGAAVLASSGRIYTGCNVENASFGLTNCAERTAIFAAIAAGERRFRAVAVHTPTPEPTMPCGACRQVIREFAPDAVILSTCQSRRQRSTHLRRLLPESFGSENLG